MIIPKVVHYCWFGNNEKSELIKTCVTSWEKFLPDYKIIQWDESNFDIERSEFAKQAYEKEKWAFVADYVRLFVLNKYGGIYLDTDIKIISDFERFLNGKKLVLCSEDMGGIVTSFIASVPNHSFISDCLNIYNNKQFITDKNSMDLTPNNKILKNNLIDYGFNQKNEKQLLGEGGIVYPDDYFHVKSLISGKLNLTSNSCMIHYHTLSWVPLKVRIIKLIRIKLLVPLLGPSLYYKLTFFVKTFIKNAFN